MTADSHSDDAGSWDDLRRGLLGTFSNRSDDEGRQGFASMFAPVDPWNRWPLLNPLIAVAGGAAVFVLAGVAAASLVVMSFALLAVVFLLSQVFGYEVVLPPMPMRH